MSSKISSCCRSHWYVLRWPCHSCYVDYCNHDFCTTLVMVIDVLLYPPFFLFFLELHKFLCFPLRIWKPDLIRYFEPQKLLHFFFRFWTGCSSSFYIFNKHCAFIFGPSKTGFKNSLRMYRTNSQWVLQLPLMWCSIASKSIPFLRSRLSRSLLLSTSTSAFESLQTILPRCPVS